MSYVLHDAIIVTGYDLDVLTDLHKEVCKLTRLNVSPILPSMVSTGGWEPPRNVNGYHTFVVIPDGSKEGWDESSTGDRERDAIRRLLHQYPYIEWVEVRYGYPDFGHPYPLPCVSYASTPG